MFELHQPVSSITHLLGSVLAIAGGYYMIRKGWGNTWRVTSLVLFSVCMLFMFTMSGIFHAFPPGLGREVFRRFDYAAIYAMIAGTATPIHVILFRGWWRRGMLILLWSCAITGMMLTMVLIDHMPEWLTLSIYLTMGWSAILSILKAGKIYGFKAIRFALWGGFAYTLGAICDFLRIPAEPTMGFASHELFHLSVIAGAALHWYFIYQWADQPTRSRLVFMVRETSSNYLSARAVGESFHITATSRLELRKRIKEVIAMRVHPALIPPRIRFRFYKDYTISAE